MTNSAGLSWTELIAALAEAGGASKGPLWEEVHLRVRRLARRLLAGNAIDSDAADDAAQALLEKMQDPETLARLRALHHPEGYFVVAIRNQAIDSMRRQKVETLSFEELAQSPADLRDAEEVVAVREQMLHLRAALFQLDPAEQELLVLRFWNGLGIQEIAHIVDQSYSNVAVRLFRLMRQLRGELDK